MFTQRTLLRPVVPLSQFRVYSPSVLLPSSVRESHTPLFTEERKHWDCRRHDMNEGLWTPNTHPLNKSKGRLSWGRAFLRTRVRPDSECARPQNRPVIGLRAPLRGWSRKALSNYFPCVCELPASPCNGTDRIPVPWCWKESPCGILGPHQQAPACFQSPRIKTGDRALVIQCIAQTRTF